jgi:hypothetical protein
MESKLKLEGKLLSKLLKGGNDIEKFIFKNKFNWNLFLTLAKNHELLPFIYYRFKNTSDLVPEDIFKFLEKVYEANLARNLILWKEFVNIYQALTQKGIRIVPLKGFDLEMRFSGIIHQRVMKDIDILIEKKNLKNAIEVLIQHGYKKYLTGNTEEYWLTKQCHLAFKKEHKLFQHGILIEVHWALDLPPRDKILSDMWERIRFKEYHGIKIGILSPEDCIFSLVLHNRRFGNILSLKQIWDLKQLFEYYTLDIDYILKTAQKYKLNSVLYFALTQLNLIFDAEDIPLIIKNLKIGHFKKNKIENLIHDYTFSPLLLTKKRNIYLKAHFLLYDTWREPFWYILNVPYEQFCKFYKLPSYTNKSIFLYSIRILYFTFSLLLNSIKNLNSRQN